MVKQGDIFELCISRSPVKMNFKGGGFGQNVAGSDFMQVLENSVNRGSTYNLLGSSKACNGLKNPEQANRRVIFSKAGFNGRKALMDTCHGNTVEREKSSPVTEEETVNRKSGTEDVINLLSCLFGITPSDLNQLLQLAGVEAQELCSEEALKQFESMIADITGLDIQERNMLRALLSELETLTDSQAGTPEAMVKDMVSLRELIGGEKANFNPDDSEEGTFIAERLIQKIRLKFKSLNAENTGKSKMHGFFGQLTIEQAKGSIPEDLGDAGEVTVDIAEDAEFKDAVYSSKAGTFEGKNEKNPHKHEGLSSFDEGWTENGREFTVGKDFTEFYGSHIFENTGIEDAVYKLEEISNIPVGGLFRDQEIISQVVNKAYVFLEGEKSEMVVHLKPDYLGKLEMQVVTERGMVAAKFIAENQQVKQILESNMQLLKDSLEKQGMVVQEFSVSVRDDSRREQHAQSRQQLPEGRREKNTAGKVLQRELYMVTAANVNPYLRNGRSIDLIA